MNHAEESPHQNENLNNISDKITTNSNLTIEANFGPDCQILKCPYCHSFINTRVKSKVTIKTHLCAIILGLCGCCICFGCPYCKQTCKDSYHYCSECDAFLGSYRF